MSITLKVEFPHLGGAVKAMRFSTDIPIQQVLVEIREKVDFSASDASGVDHWLFLPPQGRYTAKWLRPGFSLGYYQLANELLLIFKKKHRPIKVRLVDGTQKQVVVDESEPVTKIRDTIAKKLGIKRPMEYGLRLMGAKEGVWLSGATDLYEQGAKEEDVIIFDKNYFLHDDKVDQSDPTELHILFIKCVDNIIQGNYPVAQSDATRLAALQIHATYGDFNATKHKAGFLELATFVPAPLLKSLKDKRKFEVSLLDEWKKWIGKTDLEAKFRYVQTVRGLPTYGVTFYQCQEEDPKKRGHLIPSLLGLTAKKILKCDPRSRQVIREWSIEEMQRWEGLHGKFTFDFGPHGGVNGTSLWTVVTTEFDKISDRVKGYIELILESRKLGAQVIEIDQPVALAVEEDALPQFQSASSSRNTSAKGIEGAIGTTSTLQQNVRAARSQSRVNVAPIPPSILLERLHNVERNMQNSVNQLLNAINTPMKQGQQVDRDDVDRLAQLLVDQLEFFSRDAEKLAAGADPALIESSYALVGAVGSVLEAARTVTKAQNTSDPAVQQTFAVAKQKYADAMLLMQSAQEYKLNDQATSELLIGAAKSVAQSSDYLLDYAKALQTAVPSDVVSNYVKQIVIAKESLVASAETLGVAAINSAAKKTFADNASFLSGLASGLYNTAYYSGASPELLSNIEYYSQEVTNGTAKFIAATDTAESRARVVDLSSSFTSLASSLQELKDPMTDSSKLVGVLKTVAMSFNEMKTLALQVAEGQSPEVQIALETSAESIRNQFNELQAVSKILYHNPNDDGAVKQIPVVVEKIEAELRQMMKDIDVISAPIELRSASKQLAGKGFELVATATKYFYTDADLMGKVNAINSTLTPLLDSVKSATLKPSDNRLQEKLAMDVRALAAPIAQVVAAVKRTRGLSPEAEADINAVVGSTQSSLQRLMAAVNRTETAAKSGADVSEAVDKIQGNASQIEAVEFSAVRGILTAPVGQTHEGATELLVQFAEGLTNNVEQLVRLADATAPLAPPAKSAAESMSDIVTACELLAGLVSKEAQADMFKSVKAVNSSVLKVVNATQEARKQKGSAQHVETMRNARQEVRKNVSDLVALAKGMNTRDLDEAVESLKADVDRVRADAPPPSSSSSDFKQAVKDVDKTTKSLVSACNQLAFVAKNQPRRVSIAAKMVSSTAKQLVGAVNSAASASPSKETKSSLVTTTKSLIKDALELTETARTTAVTKAFGDLESAAQRVATTAESLEIVSSSPSSPGSASSASARFPDIAEAINTIQGEITILDKVAPSPSYTPASSNSSASVTVPTEGKGTRAVLADLDTATQNLAGNVTRLIDAAHVGTQKVGIYAKECATGVSAIVNAAAVSKLPMKQQQQHVLDDKATYLLEHCNKIIYAPGNAAVVGPSTLEIGKYSKDIATSARDVAIGLASDKERQTAYTNAAKAFAQGVPKLVNAVKSKAKPELIQKTAEFLLKTVYTMEAARLGVTSEELSEGPDVPVSPAIADQLVTAARAVSNSASNFLTAASHLAGNPNNMSLSRALSEKSDDFASTIGNVLQLTRQMDPAKQECSVASQELKQAVGEIDASIVNLGVGLLEQPQGKTSQQVNTDFVELVNSFVSDISLLMSAYEKSGTSGESLLGATRAIRQKIPEVVQSSREIAAVLDPETGKVVLQNTKRFADSLHNLVNEMFVGGEKTGELGKLATDSVGELLGQLKAGNELLSELNEVPAKVRNLNAEILQKPTAATGRPFAEIKESIVASVRAVTAAGSSLRACDFNRVGAVSLQARTLARTLPGLLSNVRDAVQTIPDDNLRQVMTNSTAQLVDQVAVLITAAKKTVENNNNLASQSELDTAFGAFGECVRDVLSSVKRGALGESKIDDGAEALSSSIGKLGSLSIFASAGQELEGAKKVSLPLNQQISKLQADAPKISQLAQSLANTPTMTQEQLGDVVSSFVTATNNLVESAISAAATSGNSTEQQAILNSARTVAIAAKQVILSAKDAQKNSSDSTARSTLNAALTGIPRALETFTSVISGGSSNSAARQLDAAKARLASVDSLVEALPSANASSIMDSARAIQMATAGLVFVSNPDDLVDATNNATVAVEDFLANVKGAAGASDSATRGVGLEISGNAKIVVEKMVTLLEAAKGSREDPAAVAKVEAAAAQVNNSISNLVGSVKKLPGGGSVNLPTQTDLAAQAQRELSTSSDSIQRALESLPLRGVGIDTSSIQLTDANIPDAIIGTSRALAETTQKLLGHASAAFRDKPADNATWSIGLSSSAQKLSVSVGQLLTASSEAAKGKFQEEQIVGEAKKLANLSKQILLATASSKLPQETQADLTESAKELAKITSEIVRVAQTAGEINLRKEASRRRSSSTWGVSGNVVERLEQQAAILRLEKQLEEAKRAMQRRN